MDITHTAKKNNRSNDMNKDELRKRIIEILNDNTSLIDYRGFEDRPVIHGEQIPFIADDIISCFADVVSPADEYIIKLKVDKETFECYKQGKITGLSMYGSAGSVTK